MHYKRVVSSVQCSVCSLRCTGAAAGAGAMCSAQNSVKVQCAEFGSDLKV